MEACHSMVILEMGSLLILEIPSQPLTGGGELRIKVLI